MQTVATDSTFTAPKKAKTATEPAPTPDQISKVQAEALKLWDGGHKKGKEAIFDQAKACDMVIVVNRGPNLKGAALAAWFKDKLAINLNTAYQWQAIHRTENYLRSLNLPENWTVYYLASQLFGESEEQNKTTVEAFKVHFHDFLSEDITGATIKHFKSLYVSNVVALKVEGGKNEVEYATDEKGGPASYTGSAAKPPAQIKAETKEAEGKLTEEQKKARYEEELHEFDADNNFLTYPKETLAMMEAEKNHFVDLQFQIAMKRIMRQYKLTNVEVELKSVSAHA